jgi:Na+/phosphate symporter
MMHILQANVAIAFIIVAAVGGFIALMLSMYVPWRETRWYYATSLLMLFIGIALIPVAP